MKFVGGKFTLKDTFNDVIISTNNVVIEEKNGMLYSKEIHYIYFTIYDDSADVLNRVMWLLNCGNAKTIEVFLNGQFTTINIRNTIIERDMFIMFVDGEKDGKPDMVGIEISLPFSKVCRSVVK